MLIAGCEDGLIFIKWLITNMPRESDLGPKVTVEVCCPELVAELYRRLFIPAYCHRKPRAYSSEIYSEHVGLYYKLSVF